MSKIVLKVDNMSKLYRLGEVGTGTISHDLNRWWAKIRGKEDPFAKIGQTNDRTKKAKSDYVWALKDIDFEVKEGDVLGIIGRNGAGKSTLLKIISQITSPTQGGIKGKGRIAALLEVGTGMNPELTARENIYLNGAILGMRKFEIDRKFDEIVDFSGCSLYVDTPLKRFSSGMRVRLGFAVAAFLEPEILIVDEVLAVGDAEFQKKAIGKMQDVSKTEGRTVLFVSHNMAAVKSLCNRGLVLENGQVAFNGDVDGSLDYYFKSNQATQDLSLIDRKDRSGSGIIKVIGIDLFDIKGNLINQIISGEYLKIRLHFDGKLNKVEVNRLFVGIGFNDQQENRIVSFFSDEMGANFDKYKDSNFVDLEIPQFNLRAAIYDLIFQINVGSTGVEDLIDTMEKALEVQVLPGDFWNSGKVNRNGNYSIINGYYNKYE
jgi:lipopolysaccharide transport system ATP-binding protein